MTLSAQQQSLGFTRGKDGQLQAVAIGASGGGIAWEWLFGVNRSLMIEGLRPRGIDLERAAAIRAHVIKTTLGLAGIYDFVAAALRTLDQLF